MAPSLTRARGRALRRAAFFFSLLVTVSVRAEGFLPHTVGTAWEYAQTGAEPGRFTVRVAGEENLEGKDLLRLETTAEGRLIQVQFVAVDERGLLMHARRSTAGDLATFKSPRVLLPIPLQAGTKWELQDEVAGTTMRQVFQASAEETVVVPAGEFRAYRLHCEQPWPLSIMIDRWFAPGTGFVKEITTMRGPGGRLLSRVTTVLTKFEPGPPAPEPPPSAMISLADSTPAPKPSLTLEVAAERDGPPVASFSSDAPNIYVHWRGEHLKLYSRVRVAWVVEDVGEVAEPNFVVDENETEITEREFGARFVLSRPKDGWAAGRYRLELYLDDVLRSEIGVVITE